MFGGAMVYTFEVKQVKTMADSSFNVTLNLPEGAHQEAYELIKRRGQIIVLEDITQEVAEQREDDWKTD